MIEPGGLNGFSRKKSGKQKEIGWYVGGESSSLQPWSMGRVDGWLEWLHLTYKWPVCYGKGSAGPGRSLEIGCSIVKSGHTKGGEGRGNWG